MPRLTRQEMFDRAYRGLASQGFTRCTNVEGTACVYNDGTGRHCAWGWVEPDIQPGQYDGLAVDQIETAVTCKFKVQDDEFAFQLQKVHDRKSNVSMRDRLIMLAKKYGLTVPQL